ncbi:hypothetical protein [Ottowia sp.]|uniref:hypothetical protein n=1 Tax=Ottowia sp. TaxID=1898956 RepID=UPI002CB65F87|nr:hypothetical protein [Ottowia sp.]HMM72567.1 hypothetical protein [Rhodocyclaceae bacterium]HRN77093.1 hypothetical protein [Ottowia sp.]HRO52829.1 hypothetical protein [Alicycliphilus sp.]HRQ03981.1 hypothetical protein [Ottowia sp.]
MFLVADHGGVPSARGIGRATVTPEGATPGQDLAPLDIAQLFKTDNSTEYLPASSPPEKAESQRETIGRSELLAPDGRK